MKLVYIINDKRDFDRFVSILMQNGKEVDHLFLIL